MRISELVTTPPQPISREEYLSRRKALQQLQMDPDIVKDPTLANEVMVKIVQLNRRAKASGIIEDFELDEKASPDLCRSTKRLGRSDYSSCVSQGLRPHQSKGKGHTDGHGHYLKGRKAKSVRYGGDVKDYSGK